MSFRFISKSADAHVVEEALDACERVALACEAAGFHRYSDRLCLVQLSTEAETFILDPLGFDVAPVLSDPLEDPGVQILMHGGDYDVRLLDRDLDLHPTNLFDTQIAAALLGLPSLGLSALLEDHLGVKLSKKHQRADWAKRPLPDGMLEYAASDTRHLHALADILAEQLEARGRTGWAEEEFRLLEEVRWEEDEDEDPVTRVKGAHRLGVREVATLREALQWRDEVARERDRAPFRVVGDRPLVEASLSRPADVDALASVKGMNASLARHEGPGLLQRWDRLDEVPVGELEPYPPRSGNGRGRPPPEVEDRAARLKAARNRRAEALGMDRGTLLPNAVLLEIAWTQPGDVRELASVPGIKSWQVEEMWPALRDVLKP